jgi:hypothetical protein
MLRWKLLDAVSTSNLESFARCLTAWPLALTPLDVMNVRLVHRLLDTHFPSRAYYGATPD